MTEEEATEADLAIPQAPADHPHESLEDAPVQQKRDEWIVAGYRALLGRDPDPGGLAAYRQALTNPDHDLAWFLRTLLNSVEFCQSMTRTRPLWPERKPVCTLIRGKRRLWIDLHDSYVSFGCLQDCYEPSETSFILNRLNRGDTFLDIGANIGWFSILAADAVGDTGKVHAFEPRTQTFELLERSVVDNLLQDRVALHKVALGAEDAELRLLWSADTINPGSARLERPGEDTEGFQGESVPIVRLDSLDLGDNIPLIKMDVEGAEPLVLRGAEALLARCRPTILTEIFAASIPHVSGMELEEYFAYLRSLDYRMFYLQEGEAAGEITDPALLHQEHPFNCVLIHESRLRRDAQPGGSATEDSASHLPPLWVSHAPPMTSYAQNFEDVLLRRALFGISDGFYVDVGAWEPVSDSVTYWFYEQGWHGINIEPNEPLWQKLCEARPRDINLKIGVGREPGTATLFDFDGSGLATMSETIATGHELKGLPISHRQVVDIVRLDNLLDQHAAGITIDFLKIDAEGREEDILTSMAFTTHRPRILLVEATEPNSPKPSWATWEPHVLANGYLFVWFDGLNRWYLRQEDAWRQDYFRTPVNVFDNFTLAKR